MKNIIKAALVTIPYTGKYLKEIENSLAPAKIFHVPDNDEAAISKALQEADVAMLGGDISLQILEEGKHLRWIHCNHAGLALSARPEIFERNIILTGASGRSSPVLAEHAFFLLLSLIYDSPTLMVNQQRHVWDGGMYANRRGIFNKTIGIVGMGYIGKEIAVRAKAFGMKVLAYDKSFNGTPDYIDSFFSGDAGDSIDGLLKESDVVALAIRLNNETYRMIDKRAFSLMKPTAYLINISRGAVVDENALYEALRDGVIAGAGSDVFEVEPLQADSPLWGLSNMIITPHCTPEVPDMPGNCVQIIKHNAHAYKEGLPMLNKLELRDVYTKEAIK